MAHRSKEQDRKAADEDALKARLWREAVELRVLDKAKRLAFTYDPSTPAVRAVRAWFRNGCRPHLMLRGGVGCGKTTAAAVGVMLWCEPWSHSRWGDVSWLTPDELVSAVFHPYDEHSMKLRRFLVIDDMGTEKKVDFEAALTKTINTGDHVILATTNLLVQNDDPKKTFAGRYDLRLIERLSESFETYDLPGESLRRKVGVF